MIDLRRGSEKLILLLIVVVFVTWVTVRYVGIPSPLRVVSEHESAASAGREPAKPKYHPSLNVVNSFPSEELDYRDCVPLPASPNPNVKMCIYPAKDDIYVSGQIKNGQLFERDLVLQMAEALKNDSSLQFIDMGANIGVYTMFAAACGKTVLSVEMLPANIHHIQTSLSVSGLGSQVTLVNNALYSDHRSLTANFISKNVGATHLNVSKTDFKHFGMVEDNSHTVTVNTICIDDLIPLLKSKRVYIKIDIERTEAKALQCAHKFFKEVDVRIIQMEWLAKSKEEIVSINQFMLEHGFRASSKAFKLVPVNTNVATTPGSNVFFIRA